MVEVSVLDAVDGRVENTLPRLACYNIFFFFFLELLKLLKLQDKYQKHSPL